MIDGSEKRNRQLVFELQNSHVCEKRSKSYMTFCGCIMLTLKYRAMRGSRSELAPA